jgi:beta-glucosidase
MVSTSYLNHLENLVNAGKVSLDLINEAVLRMLQFKFQIGLFDNPYKHIYANPEQYMRNSETLELAHQVALESVVLLKNSHDLLPLSKQGKKIALIGPFANSNQVVGAWGSLAKDAECVSLLTGISSLVGADALLCTAGCAINDQDRLGFAEALELAKQADVVILALGEDHN